MVDPVSIGAGAYNPRAAALWISKNPSAAPAQVREALVAAGNSDWDSRQDPDNQKEPLDDVSSF